MKKLILTISFAFTMLFANAQLKVFTTGKTAIGSTTTPNQALDVTGDISLVNASGAIRINNSRLLWTNSNNNSVYVGIEAGNSATGNGNAFMGYRSGYTNTTGAGNSFFGYEAGYTSNSTTANSSFVGYQSGKNTSTGTDNVFMGYQTGYTNTSGSRNTFLGNGAGLTNSTGSDNVCIGYLSGYSNTTSGNSFIGRESGYYNTSGTANAFVGYQAGFSNATTGYNAFVGYQAGYSNTANYNAFVGYRAGYANTSGSGNVFMGYAAGNSNQGGTRNSFTGYQTGYACVSGNYNTAYGYRASANTTGTGNSSLGHEAGLVNTTGTYNTCIGYGADVTANNLTYATALGAGAIAQGSYTVSIGAAACTTLYAGTTAIQSYSDGRFKTDVTENVKGLAFIKKLRPVTYKMNTEEIDDYMLQNMPDSIKTAHKQGINYAPSMSMVHSGFIAQEVEQAAQDVSFNSTIVHHPSNSTDPYALGYSEFVVPLVKAVQELSSTSDSSTTAQDSIIDALQNQINELSERLNACCSANRTAPVNGNNSGINGSSDSDIKDDKATINGAILYQNNPNPFSTRTQIGYYLPAECNSCFIYIFDMNGKLLKSYPITQKGKGALEISGNEFEPGMYIYSLVANNTEVDTKKMILTK